MQFQVTDMPAGKVNGYLPMSSLKDHNPDINWEQGSLKWWSEYCKAHCLGKERGIEFITEEELLAEDPDNIFVMGMALYTDEDGEDIKIKFFFFFFFFFFFLNHMHLFKVQRQPSSVSSTHPAIEISTPRDYHHFSKLHPPLWVRSRGWSHTSSTLPFP